MTAMVKPKVEVGWLLELMDLTPGDTHSAGWLCTCPGSGRIQFACVPEWALRFARREDAETMGKILSENNIANPGIGHKFMATEHVWDS
jgi:hypothetical protein